jgi:membrane protein insertase Oxa1/YidC/SpoIIIJ
VAALGGRAGHFVILELLDTALFQPLLQIYGGLFQLIPESLGMGSRLGVFSVIVNLVLLPIYIQMEESSRRMREVKAQVDRDVGRMRRYFRGRERYFYVRAVYRQHRYHPISALFGSADLFIQILVFATVFRFLSDLPALAGQSFGPIADLSRPDGLLGGLNFLPLLMTAINVASAFAYVDERSKRIQALALAALFLVLLHSSPSGLVLYWTANNLFSLLRNLLGRKVLPYLPARLKKPLATIAQQR